MLSRGQQTVLPHRDALGRRVFLFRAGDWDPAAVPPGDVFAANFLCLEMMAREAKTQVAGIVVVLGKPRRPCAVAKTRMRLDMLVGP